jgi:hypothetical protein
MNEQINNGGKDIRGRLFGNLIEAERQRMSAEHFIKVIMPLAQDNKLLIRALERVHKGVVLIISSVLHFEYFFKRIKLTKDNEKNLEVFFNISEKYGLDWTDVGKIREIIILGNKHKQSGMEFSRLNGAVILDDNLKHYNLNLKKLKEFLIIESKLLSGAEKVLKEGFRAEK